MRTVRVNVGGIEYAITWGSGPGELRKAYASAAALVASADDDDYVAGMYLLNKISAERV